MRFDPQSNLVQDEFDEAALSDTPPRSRRALAATIGVGLLVVSAAAWATVGGF
jgi:hypothetical protein